MIIGKRRGCGEDGVAVVEMKRVILVYEADGLYITKIEKGYWATVSSTARIWFERFSGVQK
jgi:hypothetical protein